jgi:acetoin utilization deacetylase AcuC-like enzyme
LTGIVYDDIFLEHGDPYHPESAARLEAITARLAEVGLHERMTELPTRAAQVEEICWLHDDDYVADLRAICDAGGGALDLDTIATEATYEAALVAAGSCIDAARAVVRGEVNNAFCLVRPPGHHSLPHRGMGFCFFNNIALAAEALTRDGLSRVAIVDYDCHHGNGTQEMFYHRGDVLYISLHQHPLYPGTGSIDEVGVDEGAGTNLNLPLLPQAQDAHYARAFAEVVLPALAQYQPQAILISAGYDGHFMEPLAQMSLTAGGFHAMTRSLVEAAQELCEGHVTAVLEGGYHLEFGLPESAEATARALLGDPVEAGWHEPDEPPHPLAGERVEEALSYAIEVHRKRLSL